MWIGKLILKVFMIACRNSSSFSFGPSLSMQVTSQGSCRQPQHHIFQKVWKILFPLQSTQRAKKFKTQKILSTGWLCRLEDAAQAIFHTQKQISTIIILALSYGRAYIGTQTDQWNVTNSK